VRKNFAKAVKKLERAMYTHAKNLEFEEAAKVRDRLKVLKESWLGARTEF